ncbi:MAG TPA: nuclear transport factor 2 family protein [Roseomonas sp.]|jgi:ketosteroid isomerase-like protein
MDSEDAATPPTVARLAQLYGEYVRGNRDALFDALTEDVVWASNGAQALPWSGTHNGRAGVAAYFRHLDSEIEVVGYAVERVIAQGDWIAVIAKARARFRSGEERILAKVDVVRMDGDRVAEFHEYYDSAGMERAMAAPAAVARRDPPPMVRAAAPSDAGVRQGGLG